jgi:ATP-dependent Clp protease ATP-binding subunit ClpC
MLERFTERARRVVVLATEEARRRGHGAVGPEHLLLGLLRDGEGRGAHLLDQFGVSREALAAEAARVLDAMPVTMPAAEGPRELSGALRQVLVRAFEIDPQHHRHRVGTEHLLCALFHDEESPGFAIVRDAGADLDRARRLLGMGRRLFGRASDESVHLIATSSWRVRI